MIDCGTCRYGEEPWYGKHCEACDEAFSGYEPDDDGCESCLYMNEPEDGEHCSRCSRNAVDMYKPMTNGLWLRAKTNHEIAEWIHRMRNYEPEFIEKWLNSPVIEWRRK